MTLLRVQGECKSMSEGHCPPPDGSEDACSSEFQARRKHAPKPRRASETRALNTSRNRAGLVARAAPRRAEKAGQVRVILSDARSRVQCVGKRLCPVLSGLLWWQQVGWDAMQLLAQQCQGRGWGVREKVKLKGWTVLSR